MLIHLSHFPGPLQEEKNQIEQLIRQLTNNDAHFDYEIYFSEVFHKKRGFDVVIANPPYVRQEAIKDIKPELKKTFGYFFCGTADLYTYFYKRGLEILKPSGHLCFIAPNKFMRAGYGKNTRKLLTKEAEPKIIIDFGELPVFEAGTDPAIILVMKNISASSDFVAAVIKLAEEIPRVVDVVEERGFTLKISSLSIDGWTLERPDVINLISKLRNCGKPLGEYVNGKFYRGILTGLNEAFVIDELTKLRLISADPKCTSVISPWLRGRDLCKWKPEWARLYIIAIPSSANKVWPWSTAKSEPEARIKFEQTFPSIHEHLSQWEKGLRDRDDKGIFWWELRSCTYYNEFTVPKIFYADIGKLMKASYDTSGAFCANTSYIIPTEDLSILGLLHSKLFDWYIRHLFQALGDPWSGGRIRFFTQL